MLTHLLIYLFTHIKLKGILAVAFIISGLFFILPSSVQAATYTVTKTADTNDGTCDADCSLRESVAAANSNVGADTIEFNIPSSDGGYVAPSGDTQAYWSLSVGSQISLTDDSGVYINGYSQSGASRNTAAFGQTLNTILTIEVVSTITNAHAVSITGDNNHIAGLSLRSASANFYTIDINTSSSNVIEGNFFGSNITGTTSTGFSSVTIENSSGSNTIGTDGNGTGDSGEKNLFLGSNSALSTQGTIQLQGGNSAVIAGNYIGVDKTTRTCGSGTMRRQAIHLGSGSGHRIGTNYDGVSDAEEANILACINTDLRAVVRLAAVSNGYIQGNYIGTNTYDDALSSSAVAGIVFRDSATTSYVVKGNIIAHNGGAGIAQTVSTTVGATFTQNQIYSNSGIGIDLGTNGVTVNDPGDTDTGANNLMNFPVITSIQDIGGSKFRIKGTMDFNPSETPITVEIFKSDNAAGGYGGSTVYLSTVTVDSSGDWSSDVLLSGNTWSERIWFTTTATNANGSTSEFSQNAGVGGSNSQPIYTTCQEKGPTSPPSLYGAVAQSSTSVLLYFTPPKGDYTYYFLEYGEKPNTYYFGNPNIGFKPMSSYLVKNLKPATKYYFRVGASNGCASGGWSNEFARYTLGASTTKEEESQIRNTSPPSTSIPASPSEPKESGAEGKIRKTQRISPLAVISLVGISFVSLLYLIGRRAVK